MTTYSSQRNLTQYSLELVNQVNDGNNIYIFHNFLTHREEAEMEQSALFEDEENIRIIKSLYGKLGYEPTDVDETHFVVIASVGTSSTQVYTKEYVIGGFLIGSIAMHEDPRVAGEVLRQIVTIMRAKGINVPILLVNSIGFAVKISVAINNLTETILPLVINDEKLKKAELAGDLIAVSKEKKEVESGSRILLELARVGHDLDLEKPCIIQSREKPKLKGDWLEVLSKTVGEKYPQGVYIVDFGGGGPDLNFYKPGEGVGCGLSAVDKDRSLRKVQPAFVQEMLRGEFATSLGFQNAVNFLREKIGAHAALHRVSPVVCKVYQTGMARQQHYLGHINPVADMSVFELDTHLNGYSRRLEEELLDSGIRLEHEFLSQRDEAEMEQRAHFGSEENMAILKDLFEKVGHVPGDEEAVHVAVVVSVGTSSTQVYSKRDLIGSFLIGSNAMYEDAGVAGKVLHAIILEVRKRGIYAPIVLCNSVGFVVKKSANVNHLAQMTEAQLAIVINDTKLREAQHAARDSEAVTKEAKEVVSGKRILRELHRVCCELRLEKPCIVQAAHDLPKLRSVDWLEVQAKAVGEQHARGVYVVDFGGGGPDIHFYRPPAALGDGYGLLPVDHDRSLRQNQPTFVREMIHCRYITSESFRSIVSFLREKITAHSFNSRLASQSLDPVLCKVYQTGMARQQHFLGHIDLVTDITIFPAPPPAPAPPAPPKVPSSTHPSKPVQRYDSSPIAPRPGTPKDSETCVATCVLC